jgi:hypothetical protein
MPVIQATQEAMTLCSNPIAIKKRMKEKQKVEGITEQLLFHVGNKQAEQLNILTD